MNKQSSGLQAGPLVDSQAINLGVYFSGEKKKKKVQEQNYHSFLKKNEGEKSTCEVMLVRLFEKLRAKGCQVLLTQGQPAPCCPEPAAPAHSTSGRCGNHVHLLSALFINGALPEIGTSEPKSGIQPAGAEHRQ